LYAGTDEPKSGADSDVNVKEAEATKGAAEIRVIPKVLEFDFMPGEETRKMVQSPRIHPREYHQENADFEGEDRE
jgi:hypothetical protein